MIYRMTRSNRALTEPDDPAAPYPMYGPYETPVGGTAWENIEVNKDRELFENQGLFRGFWEKLFGVDVRNTPETALDKKTPIPANEKPKIFSNRNAAILTTVILIGFIIRKSLK